METGRVPSPPRRHAKRGLDALGNTGYSVIWIAQVKLRMGGPHAPARNATIRHSLQHNLLDSARMNASRLGLGEGAVDTLMSYISTTMLPRILEAQRTGIAPSDVTMEVDASTETQEESAIPGELAPSSLATRPADCDPCDPRRTADQAE